MLLLIFGVVDVVVVDAAIFASDDVASVAFVLVADVSVAANVTCGDVLLMMLKL